MLLSLALMTFILAFSRFSNWKVPHRMNLPSKYLHCFIKELKNFFSYRRWLCLTKYNLTKWTFIGSLRMQCSAGTACNVKPVFKSVSKRLHLRDILNAIMNNTYISSTCIAHTLSPFCLPSCSSTELTWGLVISVNRKKSFYPSAGIHRGVNSGREGTQVSCA